MGAADVGIGHQVHRASQGVGAEAHGHDAAVDFHTLYEVDRDIGDPVRVPGEVEGHAVEEKADLIPREAIEREARARSEPTCPAHTHALGARQHLAEIRGSPLRFLGLDHLDGLRGPPESVGLGGAADHDIDWKFGRTNHGLRRGRRRLGWDRRRSGPSFLGRGGLRGQLEIVGVKDERCDGLFSPASRRETESHGRFLRGFVEPISSRLHDLGLRDAPRGVDAELQHHAALPPGRACLHRIRRLGGLEELGRVHRALARCARLRRRRAARFRILREGGRRNREDEGQAPGPSGARKTTSTDHR